MPDADSDRVLLNRRAVRVSAVSLDDGGYKASNTQAKEDLEDQTIFAGTEDKMLQNIRVYWLVFVVYWGIVLFGYNIGIAGGVISQPIFCKHFGLLDANGKAITSKTNAVSSNVVSVL
ncbi:hypothetical protein B0H13DRAFT_2333121 [Mycena leptocephala]|nr:hypothetical protein B0H13DRAFT_2333121 [Mycena leptocephala]